MTARGLAVVAVFGVLAMQLVDWAVVSSLQHRITKLEHACVPVDTGGGVTQCAQPRVVLP